MNLGLEKGGLSEEINKENNDKAIYILLERAGVRFKKENKNQKDHSIRYKTDIIDFNLNYIDNIDKITKEENQKKLLEEKGYNIIGIATHIYGCAFDLSLTAIFNYEHQERIKGLVMATCCHHICRVELLNHLYYYMDILKMNIKEIIFLFKVKVGSFHMEKIEILGKKIKKMKRMKKMKKILMQVMIVMKNLEKIKMILIKFLRREILTENI